MVTSSWHNVLTFCLILAVLLALFSLSSSALAAADSSIPSDSSPVTLSSPPLLLTAETPPSLDNPSTSPLSLPLGVEAPFGRGVYIYNGVANNTGMYAFACPSTTGRIAWVTCSDNQTDTYALRYYPLSDPDTAEVVNTFTLDYTYQSEGLYYHANSFGGQTNVYLPYFSSLADGLAAVRHLIDSAVTGVPMSYSLPAGNVAFFHLPTSANAPIVYDLETTFPVLDLSSYSLNNQVSTVVSSLPSGVTSAPSSPTIPWSANGKLNIFGLSRHQKYESTIPLSYAGQYLMVCNPLYYPVTPGGGQGISPPENGSIDINISFCDGVTVLPLDSRLQFGGSGLVVDATTTGDSYTGTPDGDNGIVWTDPDGGSSAPAVGGNTQVDSVNDSIFDYLRNIVQILSDFLRGPVDAVRTVVDALRSFMASFVQLYQWLPAPVYNLITAGLMIAVTIGVIKIFV